MKGALTFGQGAIAAVALYAVIVVLPYIPHWFRSLWTKVTHDIQHL